jgi:hypothetical protein
MNSETSSNLQPSRSVFRLSVSSKHSLRNKRRSLYDSFTYHPFVKASSQSNENELIASITARTSQSIRVTRMLILVSTCFLILNAPAHLCVIALKIYTSINTPDTALLNENTKYDYYHQINNGSSTNETIISLLVHEHVLEDQITIHLFYMAVSLTQLIAYASYSINFFLYSFSGIAFRTSLRQLINKFREH